MTPDTILRPILAAALHLSGTGVFAVGCDGTTEHSTSSGLLDGGAGRACGGELGKTCAPSEYCAYAEGQLCGAADATAHCAPRPEACDTVYAPVCGCDGQTHGNACEAAMTGTGVLHEGPCAPAD